MIVNTVTNNVPRPIVEGWETTFKEREQLDYVDWEAVYRGDETFLGFRYRGWLYDLHDGFDLVTGDILKGWDLFQSSSYFDGIAVRFVDGGDGDPFGHVVVAHCHW